MASRFKTDSFEVIAKDVPISREEQKILREVDEMYSESNTAKDVIKKMMDESYLSFRSIYSDFSWSRRDVDRYGLAIYVPITFQVVASIQSQLNGRPPSYRLSPKDLPQDRRTANVLGDLSKSEFRRAKAMLEIASGIQTSLIFGTAFLRSYFRYDKKVGKFLKEKEVTERGERFTKADYEQGERTIYKGWSLTNDHPLKVRLPPVHEHDPQKWPYYIVREITDIRVEKKYYETFPDRLWKKENVACLKPGGDTKDDMEVFFKMDPVYRLNDVRYPGSIKDMFRTENSQTYARMTSKYHAEKLIIYDMVNDAWIKIIAGRVMEYHPNPLDEKMLPVEAMRDYKVEYSPWGMGEPQLLRYLQIEANALHTFALDGTKFATNGVFGINSAGLKNPNDLSIYPGKVFELKNMPNLTIDNVIKAFNTGDVKPSTFRMMGENSSLVGRTTGIGSSVIGGDPINPNISATDANNLKAAATTRIYERARAIEQENLTNIIDHQLAFVSQFYDEEQIAKASGGKFIKFIPYDQSKYTPEQQALDLAKGYDAVIFESDLAEGYDVVVEGESTLPISRNEKRIEGMQLLKIASETRRPPTAKELAADPALPQKFPLGIPVLDATAVAEKIVMPTFSVVDNVDEFMYDTSTLGSQDQGRGVGRPEEVLNPEKLQGDLESVQEQAPQPAEQGVNEMERIDNVV